MICQKLNDRLPQIVALQILLNRRRCPVNITGFFGSDTYAAVETFQRRKHLAPDHVVGKLTWPKLVENQQAPIVDVVDVTPDEKLKDRKTGKVIERQSSMAEVFSYLQEQDADPIGVPRQKENGVRYVVKEIQDNVGSLKNIVLLRLWGHGGDAMFGMGCGYYSAFAY